MSTVQWNWERIVCARWIFAWTADFYLKNDSQDVGTEGGVSIPSSEDAARIIFRVEGCRLLDPFLLSAPFSSAREFIFCRTVVCSWMLEVSSSRAWFEEDGAETLTVVDGEWICWVWMVLQKVVIWLSTDGRRGVGVIS